MEGVNNRESKILICFFFFFRNVFPFSFIFIFFLFFLIVSLALRFYFWFNGSGAFGASFACINCSLFEMHVLNKRKMFINECDLIGIWLLWANVYALSASSENTERCEISNANRYTQHVHCTMCTHKYKIFN